MANRYNHNRWKKAVKKAIKMLEYEYWDNQEKEEKEWIKKLQLTAEKWS